MDETFAYDSVTVARYIIAYANKHRYMINMTKLQKLLYIAYGAYMAVKGQRLTNEHPQAWPYGPVFPTTRNKLIKVDFQNIHTEDKDLFEISKDQEVNSLMALVFDKFGKNTATSLSEWSHKSGSPWSRTTEREGFNWGDRIPDEYIIDYFNTLIVKKQ